MKSFIDDTQLIRIYYDVGGQRRKDLVKALSEILLWEPKYLGAPTFAYDIGNYRITREGTILCPESCTREIANQLISNLRERGFEPTNSNLTLFVVSLPRAMFNDAALTRLHNLVKSKETVLRAALKAHALQIEVTDEKIYFPWFTLTGADGEADAYMKLIAALGKTAREQQRISAKEKAQDNLKYAMRLFLVRLGFVGEEYKQVRKILLRNLSGNCSWKDGHAPERSTNNDASMPDEMEVTHHEK